MHTYTFQDDQGGDWHFTTAGDMSGKARIQCPNGVVSIPNTILIQYVAEAVRQQRIRELEQATVAELLGVEE